jgi:hypothetical protein
MTKQFRMVFRPATRDYILQYQTYEQGTWHTTDINTDSLKMLAKWHLHTVYYDGKASYLERR